MNLKWCSLTLLLLLSGTAGFSEEPADKDKSNILFTDIPQNRIQKWTQYGNLEAFFEESGKKNGILYDKNGNPLTSSSPERRLISIDSQGKITVLDDKYDYEHTNATNDLWIVSNGAVYFIHAVSKNGDNKNDDKKYVYYLSPDRKKLIRVLDDMVNPDSLVVSPNGKYLIVSESDGITIYMYAINKDGTLSDKQLFDPEECGC